jgi:hypothetical protein
VRHQELEQLVLHVGEADRRSRDRDLVGGEVEFERPGADDVALLDPVHLQPRSRHPGLDLLARERPHEQLLRRRQRIGGTQVLRVDGGQQRHVAELVVVAQALHELAGRRLGGPGGDDY